MKASRGPLVAQHEQQANRLLPKLLPNAVAPRGDCAVATDFATELAGRGWHSRGQGRTASLGNADRMGLSGIAWDQLGRVQRSAKPFTPVQFRASPPSKKINELAEDLGVQIQAQFPPWGQVGDQ
jgi:hypothetical protein